MLVEKPHPLTSDVVVHRPQTHDQGAGACTGEGPTKAKDTLACLHFPEPALARRKDGPLDAQQVDGRHFLSGQDAIVLLRASGLSVIRTCECQARP